jgi:hypothetical protein
MKRLLFCITLLSASSLSFSQQVVIGSATPVEGITLQVRQEGAGNKGVLLPRIALAARNSTSPLPADIPSGTIIFNTRSFGVFPNEITPGLFWWDGSNKQWNDISRGLDNVSLKYTNEEGGSLSTNYNQPMWQEVQLFGTNIYNESDKVYEVNDDRSVTVKRVGLYAFYVLLAFDRTDSNNYAVRLSLTARIYVNGNAVGTEQVFSPGFTGLISIAAGKEYGRGVFTHSFTEYLELKDGDKVSVRIKRTDGDYIRNRIGTSPVVFSQEKSGIESSGDSSIVVSRIR